MSPSFVAENTAIDASSLCWKRLLQLNICRGDADGSTLPTANKIPIFQSLIVYKRRGRRGNVASFAAKNAMIDASSLSLEALIATWYMQMGCNGSTLPIANKNLFAVLYLLTSIEGDEATFRSFATAYVAIEASSASLEVLIPTLLPTGGTAKEAIF